MKLLILGGTVFLGRHIVEAAQDRGHRVTLFNRDRHNPALFPQVEKLRGDRAIAAGLSYRPLVDTVEDTLAWLKAESADAKSGETGAVDLPGGLSPARERELLQAWHQRETEK